jgi:hypothetical protein
MAKELVCFCRQMTVQFEYRQWLFGLQVTVDNRGIDFAKEQKIANRSPLEMPRVGSIGVDLKLK